MCDHLRNNSSSLEITVLGVLRTVQCEARNEAWDGVKGLFFVYHTVQGRGNRTRHDHLL